MTGADATLRARRSAPLAAVLRHLLDGPGLIASAVRDARTQDAPTSDLVGPPGLAAALVAGLATPCPQGAGRMVLVVTTTTGEADDLARDLTAYLPGDQVATLPSWETLPHERLSPASDTMGRRIALLRRIVHPDQEHLRPAVVVAPARAVLQPLVAGLAELPPVRLRAGDTVELDALVRDLVQAGYQRVDLVEQRGQVAVRGGIVDVFPPGSEHPVRVELFGDEVDEVRAFAVADQRSLHVVPDGLDAPPCRELPLTPGVRARARAAAQEHPHLADLLEEVADGRPAPGYESLSPLLVDRFESVVDLLPPGTVVLVRDPERVRRRAVDLAATDAEFTAASWAGAAEGGQAPIDLGGSSFVALEDVAQQASARGLSWWTYGPFGTDTDAQDAPVAPVPVWRGDTAKAVADLRAWLAGGARVVLTADGAGTVQRYHEVLADEGIPARLHDAALRADSFDADVVHLVQAPASDGFVERAAGVVLVPERVVTGRAARRADLRMPTRRRRGVDPLALSPGDHVVHEQHGVGRYVELTARVVAGARREYLVVEYAPRRKGQPGDRLFVPTDQLDQLSRYVGGDAPTLDRMGGSDWTKRKNRARKAVRQIAGELIKLYAARQAARGHAFGPDTPWQRELEDAFPYTETPDQLVTIDEVKRDMERPVPMDRVIAGDVGYGKTEIAVRAAFKAVQDGYQVAVLVPTTLLVQQHFQTFSERYASFPVTVRALSRFQSDAEAAAVRAGVAEGTVDVVIGTHRLLAGDVRYRNLGLVVVDEEQRFGVEHKEQLKQLRANVDVLTMSATPIPRTLEMSITGIRDMSTIATPPEERHPVLTAVGPYSQRQVAAAIRRELVREGQVFFVHNRVASIERVAARLREAVPEARIAVAHGQMSEHLLERTILDFWERAVDVLVCTTIVETGLDIANANTLIVDRADTLGLSQLHQLRGRVGRGRERAYAYFFFDPERPLTDTAHARLATIAQHSDLGAGMAVAMKDLEIRGAGNLLGAEQSGHVADVGFDLYVRLVGEAVAEYRGEAGEPEPELRVDLPVEAYLPADYVTSERLRLEAYRALSEATTDAAVAAVRDELADRYGPLPEPAEHLMRIGALRVVARARGVHEIVLQGPYIRFTPLVLGDAMQVRLQRLYPRSVVKSATSSVLVTRPTAGGLARTPVTGPELVDWARSVLADLAPPAAGGGGGESKGESKG
jgi:transcription-repair coupling factor (superfamily II helicase)